MASCNRSDRVPTNSEKKQENDESLFVNGPLTQPRGTPRLNGTSEDMIDLSGGIKSADCFCCACTCCLCPVPPKSVRSANIHK